MTVDIDGITRQPAVIEAARALAAERGLPMNWLNSNANMWMPPLPPTLFEPPDVPGLRVTYASDDFLLATKLIAQRAKDADDIVALAVRLGLSEAEDLEALVRRSTRMRAYSSSSWTATTWNARSGLEHRTRRD